ncbi:hypothetical protein P7C73_g2085, partial [Tremellales sp. Uapishka_1]
MSITTMRHNFSAHSTREPIPQREQGLQQEDGNLLLEGECQPDGDSGQWDQGFQQEEENRPWEEEYAKEEQLSPEKKLPVRGELAADAEVTMPELDGSSFSLPPAIQCSVCQEEFRSPIILRQHEVAHHPWLTVCQDCPAQLDSAQKAHEHYATVHKASDMTSVRTQTFHEALRPSLKDDKDDTPSPSSIPGHHMNARRPGDLNGHVVPTFATRWQTSPLPVPVDTPDWPSLLAPPTTRISSAHADNSPRTQPYGSPSSPWPAFSPKPWAPAWCPSSHGAVQHGTTPPAMIRTSVSSSSVSDHSTVASVAPAWQATHEVPALEATSATPNLARNSSVGPTWEFETAARQGRPPSPPSTHVTYSKPYTSAKRQKNRAASIKKGGLEPIFDQGWTNVNEAPRRARPEERSRSVRLEAERQSMVEEMVGWEAPDDEDADGW